MDFPAKKRIKVAVFPAGSEIGLEVAAALKNNKHIELYGLTSEWDHSEFIYNKLELIDNIKDPKFLTKLNDYIGEYEIDVFYPAHDLVIDFVAENLGKINCKVVTHDPEVVKICRSKRKTYELFPEISPKIITDGNGVHTWGAYFTKPDSSFGGKGAKRIYTREELWDSLEISENVTTEYLPGEEYTVDCFTDEEGQIIVLSPRSRERIRNGIAVRSQPLKLNSEEDRKLVEIATNIQNKLNFNGAWFFQAKKDKNGELKLLEIAPRIAGTSGLTRANGNNLPLMSIYNTIGILVDPIHGNFNNFLTKVERALSSKYEFNYEYDNVYIDFDDTLFIGDKVNTELMAFIYQCLNKQKNIYLITRNFGNVEGKLLEAKISPKIFQEIVRVPNISKKSSFVKNKSIFIDDSFRERYDVAVNCQAPVFDVSEIQCLLK